MAPSTRRRRQASHRDPGADYARDTPAAQAPAADPDPQGRERRSARRQDHAGRDHRRPARPAPLQGRRERAAGRTDARRGRRAQGGEVDAAWARRGAGADADAAGRGRGYPQRGEARWSSRGERIRGVDALGGTATIKPQGERGRSVQHRGLRDTWFGIQRPGGAEPVPLRKLVDRDRQRAVVRAAEEGRERRRVGPDRGVAGRGGAGHPLGPAGGAPRAARQGEAGHGGAARGAGGRPRRDEEAARQGGAAGPRPRGPARCSGGACPSSLQGPGAEPGRAASASDPRLAGADVREGGIGVVRHGDERVQVLGPVRIHITTRRDPLRGYGPRPREPAPTGRGPPKTRHGRRHPRRRDVPPEPEIHLSPNDILRNGPPATGPPARDRVSLLPLPHRRRPEAHRAQLRRGPRLARPHRRRRLRGHRGLREPRQHPEPPAQPALRHDRGPLRRAHPQDPGEHVEAVPGPRQVAHGSRFRAQEVVAPGAVDVEGGEEEAGAHRWC